MLVKAALATGSVKISRRREAWSCSSRQRLERGSEGLRREEGLEGGGGGDGECVVDVEEVGVEVVGEVREEEEEEEDVVVEGDGCGA